MYKKISADHVVETQEKKFISQDKLDTIDNLSSANSASLINERILIQNSQFTLSHVPVSSKLIYYLIMITEDINNDIVIQYELFQDYTIQDRTITLNTSDFNNYKALVSYLTV